MDDKPLSQWTDDELRASIAADESPAAKPLRDWSDEELRASIAAGERANEQRLAPHRQRIALEQQQKEANPSFGSGTPIANSYWLRRAVSFPRDLITDTIYGRARAKLDRGEAGDGDLRNIALYEAEKQNDAARQQTVGGAVAGGLVALPSHLAGLYGGGRVAEMVTPAALAGAKGVAPFVGRTAIQAGATPNVGLAAFLHGNAEAGRDPLDPRGIPAAAVRSVAEMAVLSGAGKAWGWLTGVKSAAGQTALAGLTGPINQQITDLTTYGLGLSSRYGRLQDLAEGKRGQAAAGTLLDIFNFAAMHAMHGNPEEGKRIIRDVVGTMDQQGRRGAPIDKAMEAVRAQVPEDTSPAPPSSPEISRENAESPPEPATSSTSASSTPPPAQPAAPLDDATAGLLQSVLGEKYRPPAQPEQAQAGPETAQDAPGRAPPAEAPQAAEAAPVRPSEAVEQPAAETPAAQPAESPEPTGLPVEELRQRLLAVGVKAKAWKAEKVRSEAARLKLDEFAAKPAEPQAIRPEPRPEAPAEPAPPGQSAPAAQPEPPKPTARDRILAKQRGRTAQAEMQAKPNVEARPERPAEPAPEPQLDEREQKVLAARKEGQSFRAIGRAMGVSYETVRKIEQAAQAKRGAGGSIAATEHLGSVLDRIEAGEEEHGHFDPVSGRYVVEKVREGQRVGPGQLSFDPEEVRPQAKKRLSDLDRVTDALDDLAERFQKEAEGGQLTPERQRFYESEAARLHSALGPDQGQGAEAPVEPSEASGPAPAAEVPESVVAELRRLRGTGRTYDAQKIVAELGRFWPDEAIDQARTAANLPKTQVKAPRGVGRGLTAQSAGEGRRGDIVPWLEREHVRQRAESAAGTFDPAEFDAPATPRPLPKPGDAAGGWRVAAVLPPVPAHTEVDALRRTSRPVEGRGAIVIAEHPGEGAREFSPEEWAAHADPAESGEPDTATRVAELMKKGFTRKAAEDRAAREAAPRQTRAMGAAALGELTGDGPPLDDPRLTALAHARSDAIREALGLPERAPFKGLTDKQLVEAAKAAVQADPGYPERLMAELEAKPRPTDSIETAVLLRHESMLENQLYLAEQPRPDGSIDTEAADALRAQIQRTRGVTDPIGSEAGHAFRVRQALMDDNFSIVGLLRRAEAAKGAPLTPGERAEIQQKGEAIRQADARLQAAESGEQPAEAAGRKGDMADIRIGSKRTRQSALDAIDSIRRANQSLPRRVFGYAGEALNSVRALITSMDLSAVFRQGGFFTFGHPIKAAKAFPEMLRAFASERGADRAQDALDQRPNALLYKRAGLYLADRAGPLSAQEEAFVGRLVKKIPGVAGSERAYTTFLNRMRADVFDALAASLGKGGSVGGEEAKALANFVNVATGRGALPGSLERASVPLAQLFFAPRFVASRFQLLAGQPLYGGTAGTRTQIATEYARALAGLGTFYALMHLRDDAKVEADPRSADFGKVRMGNTRIDPLAGLAQSAVFVARLVSGQTKSTANGRINPLRGDRVPVGGQTVGDVIGRFLRSKLAPVPGAVMDVLTGESVVGEKATPQHVASQLAVPLSVRDVWDALADQGVPRGVAAALLAVLGMGTQVYEPRHRRAAVTAGR